MREMEEESFVGKASPDKELEAMRRKLRPDPQPFGSGRSRRVKRKSKPGGSSGGDGECRRTTKTSSCVEFATTAVVERAHVDVHMISSCEQTAADARVHRREAPQETENR